MSWVKMDDQWPFHRKLRLVEPLDRSMWAMSIAYCSAQNTDGRMDGPMLELVAFCAGVTKPYEAAERLVSAALFELDAGGWKVHDYLGFQPSSEQRKHVSDLRAEAGKRGGQSSGKARSAPKSKPEPKTQPNGKQIASPGLPTFGTPSRPVPSSPVISSISGPSSSSVSQGSAEGTDDDDRILKALPPIADGLATIYGIVPKRRPGYRAAILRDPSDHLDAVRVIASDYPNVSAAELAELYLDTRRNAEEWPAVKPQRQCSICQATTHTAAACRLREDQP